MKKNCTYILSQRVFLLLKINQMQSSLINKETQLPGFMSVTGLAEL